MTYQELINTITKHKGPIECHIVNIGYIKITKSDLMRQLKAYEADQESGMTATVIMGLSSDYLTVDTE